MRDRYPDGFPPERGAPKAFVAPMATGNRVVEDYDLFPTIHEYVRKTLGVDMEGSAVAAVAEIEGVENYIVVKGVQDHADPDKDDRYRDYAVETSYRFLVDFIGSQLSPPKRSVPFVVPQVETPSFTGREDELKNLEAVLLGDRRDHVCTIAGLSGSGGIGKSALAVHFATLYRNRFPDGVIGIRVDGKDNDTIAREFARTFGESIDADDERDAPSIMQSIFSDREVLLIFDNAEDASIRHLVPGRLSSLIITTRNRGLPALLEVPPNARVDVPPLGESNGLDLLRKRLGSRVDAELDRAKRIVGLVGGLPLALQIVGSVLEVSWRPLSDMTDLLANERQRLSTLAIRGEPDFDVRVSFNASLKFLKEEEIDFFACLSVCDADSFALHSAAAAAGCFESIARERLDYLYRLSLVNRPEETTKTRFVLHPLLRSFAGELAEERGIAKRARGRHARYFVELFKTFDVKDRAASNAIVEDVGEAVSAARWLLQENDADYNYMVRLEPLLVRSGFWQEAAALMAQFMSMAEAKGDSYAAVQFRIQHAKFEQLRGDLQRSIAILQPAINSGSTGNDRADAMLLNTYGGALQRLGKFQEAADALERSKAISEQLGDERSLAMVLNSLGGVLQRLGKFQEAADALERSKAISEQLGDERGLAMVLNSLGGVLQRLGKQEKADQSFATSIAIGERLGDKVHLAKVHTAYGKALISRGDLAAGVDQLRKGFLLDEQNRNRRGLAIVTPLLIRNLRSQGKPEEAAEFLNRALTVAPSERALLRLSTASTEPSVSTEGVWLTGHVKRLLTPMGRPRYGFVTTDSDGMDVYFSENQIGATVFSSLLEGARVEAHVVVMADGRRQAPMIRAI
jgi:tetratricopeptide (TPR) repeat protein